MRMCPVLDPLKRTGLVVTKRSSPMTRISPKRLIAFAQCGKATAKKNYFL